MFGSSKQYQVRVYIKRYQSYTKSAKTFRKFIKDLWFDPSDDIGINSVISESGIMSCRSIPNVMLRVKEKEAKKLQKMEKNGELLLHGMKLLT